ncbi:MAG: hypothetical protein A2X94_04550 [Bdellovibrionales bacterium GWB1_55_8]|nr:MAG: hypothetical protein A2X94_04550 [Bdellovibrionales bacterium GWB1_55_8]
MDSNFGSCRVHISQRTTFMLLERMASRQVMGRMKKILVMVYIEVFLRPRYAMTHGGVPRVEYMCAG